MSGSAGTASGDWFAVGGAQASSPESDSSASAAYDLGWRYVSVLELGPFATAPSCARLHAKNVLMEWNIPRDLIADAEVVTSELVTNALRAMWALEVPQPIGLRLLANWQQLIIEVRDCHPGGPVRRPIVHGDNDREGGRGLQVVEALSNRWGCRRLNTTVKTVWAELLLPHANTNKREG